MSDVDSASFGFADTSVRPGSLKMMADQWKVKDKEARARNGSGIRPVGHVLLVRPLEVEVKTAGGIIVASASQHKREEMGQTEAEVIALGSTAYADQPTPWCKVGDRVVFARYAGTERKGSDDKTYRLISDLDVKGVLE